MRKNVFGKKFPCNARVGQRQQDTIFEHFHEIPEGEKKAKDPLNIQHSAVPLEWLTQRLNYF